MEPQAYENETTYAICDIRTLSPTVAKMARLDDYRGGDLGLLYGES